MRMRSFVSSVGVVVAAMVTMSFVAGCDNSEKDKSADSSGGGSSSSSSSTKKSSSSVNSVVGAWQIGDSGGTTPWSFNADGTFTSGSIAGTYTQNGDQITGSFQNGSVGDGTISATLSADGKSMQMDFVENWHTPPKHNPLTGTKQ